MNLIDRSADRLCRPGSRKAVRHVWRRYHVSGRQFRLESLSVNTLGKSSSLTNRIFPEEKGEWPDLDLGLSLLLNSKSRFMRALAGAGARIYGARDLRYWVLVDENTKRVAGISGIYGHSPDIHEANWVGWTCVDPRYRRQGLGRELIEFDIEKASEGGKSWLRLYTSNAPSEIAAQSLYDDMGFRIYRSEDGENGLRILYRQKKL